jgi:ribosomal protein S18 acetylase RimI-like enzyme
MIITLETDICGSRSILIVDIDNSKGFQQVAGRVEIRVWNRKVADFCRLFVREEFRRKSVGTSLIRQCYFLALQAGCEALGCEVRKDNLEAIAFYRRLGFSTVLEFEDNSLMMSRPILNGAPEKQRKEIA